MLLAGQTVRRWDSKNGDGEHRQIKPLTRFSAGLGLTRAERASIDSFPFTSFLFMLDWILFCTCSQIGNCFFAWSRPQRHPANLLPGNHLTLPLPAPASPTSPGWPSHAPPLPSPEIFVKMAMAADVRDGDLCWQAPRRCWVHCKVGARACVREIVAG